MAETEIIKSASTTSPMNEKIDSPRYLLILSCSKKKIKASGQEALNLYDGPAFRIIRASKLTNTDIMILSAKYGLISADYAISFYNRKMTLNRARQLQKKNKTILEKLLKAESYDEVYVNLGKNYLASIPFDELDFGGATIIVSKGMIGERLHNLKAWIASINTKKIRKKRCFWHELTKN